MNDIKKNYTKLLKLNKKYLNNCTDHLNNIDLLDNNILIKEHLLDSIKYYKKEILTYKLKLWHLK